MNMQTSIRRVVLFLPSLALLMLTIMPTDDLKAAELAPHLYKTVLDNGLTVIVRETPGNKAATVQIWVKAGSVYEEPHEAGITHLIEHMIFKGTPERGPGELAGAIEAKGGQVNAYTSFEQTVYHATLSARHWELALEVLADAVRHSTFDPEELEREKKVVLEELGMRNDRPNIRLFQTLMENAFQLHPYRLPVIGNVEALTAISREDILAYLEKHYHPENFAVVVVGDVNNEPVVEAVARLMGDEPRGGVTPPDPPAEPPQQQARLFKVEAGIMQSHMALALPISAFGSPDTPVLDVIAQILGHGETSRLYRVLRDDKGLVFSIDASAFTPRDPGLLEITAVLDGPAMNEALKTALIELFTLKYEEVTAEELKRAKHQLESEFIFNQERVEGQARVLGSFEFLTGHPEVEGYLEAIRAVTAADIKRVAAGYFTARTVTAGFLVPTGSGFGPDDREFSDILIRAEEAAARGETASLLKEAFLSSTHRFKLPNGITLLVREDDSIPTVAIRAVLPGGLMAETVTTNGAFAFIAELLPKGTAELSARQLSETVADMAGEISGFNGKNTFGLKADFLARFAGEGLKLVRDILLTPAFDPQEAEKIRPELLARLKQQEDALPALTFREFNRILFAGHPYGLNPLGTEEAIRGFTGEDLRQLYERHARPDRLVLAVSGAVKAEEFRERTESLFGSWTAPDATEKVKSGGFIEELLAPMPPAEPKIFTLAQAKEQVHLIIGFLGATLYDPDRFSLEVLDMVLSGQSGRLFMELRDKQSLAYSLSSFTLLGLDTGSFGIYLGTAPAKQELALTEIWKQLYRVREEAIGVEELERAKNVLIGRYELGLQTHGAQALDMALNEVYGLGQDYGLKYMEAIRAVNGEDVLAAARKYIQPDHYVMILVGADNTADGGRPGGDRTGTE